MSTLDNYHRYLALHGSRFKRTSDAHIRAAIGESTKPHLKHYARNGGVWVCSLSGKQHGASDSNSSAPEGYQQLQAYFRYIKRNLYFRYIARTTLPLESTKT